MSETYWQGEADKLHAKWIKALTDLETLKAENERLRKAGDAITHWIDYQHDKDGYPFSEAWEAANKVKKGKSV